MRIFLTCLFALSILHLTAQESKPVQFAFTAERKNDSTAVLIIKAKMAENVQLLSTQKINPEAIASSIELDTSIKAGLIGTAKEEGKLQQQNDSSLGSINVYADSVRIIQEIRLSAATSSIEGNFAWLAKQGNEYPSGTESFDVQISSSEKTTGNSSAPADPEKQEDSLVTIFFLCLAAGLLAVVTPCVFPLIPVTVSFFLKRSKTKAEGISNAFWYSISIILIYTIPTLIITLVFGDKALYNISTHPGFNIFFFVIFILFAFSLFGAFELQLPNKWANKADEKAGKGGMLGIFFMAVTLVIVSFSCTGPIVGTLLGQTSNQGIGLAPVTGMLGFSLGLALPFSMFALFPSMLKSLPKSGGWLNSVKVVFGFIELALALKFLSNVDLMYHWRLLDRDIFITIWIVISVLTGLYLLGKLKFSHDSDLPYISIPRLLFAITAFSFAVYLVPGLWGAPLNSLSGLLPPSTTQEFNLYNNSNQSAHNNSTANNNGAEPPKKHTDILHVPYGLNAYFDLEEGMAAAKALNKPVMLDFTGHSCANCRKMEDYVWKDAEVLKRLKEDFVLISLYVDEPRKLPAEEQYTNAKGEKIKTVGDKNLDYEITKFGFNAQPLYMFLDLEGNPLSNIKYGYDPDVQKFINHMETVKTEFNKRASQ